MIWLIVTADDTLYGRLDIQARQEGGSVRRAMGALDAYRQARALAQEAVIVVDMSLPTADTLLEALHSRRATAHIPLCAIHRPMPLALRRLCTDILGADTLRPVDSL